MIIKNKFSILNDFVVVWLLFIYIFLGCEKNSRPLIEVKIVCLTPITKSGGKPIPEKIGELFLPFGVCDKTWLRINPTFLDLTKWIKRMFQI